MGIVYKMLGKNGAFMVPIQSTGLAVGQVVSYGDMANPRHKAVITSAEGTAYGQPCTFIDGSHRTTVSITSLDGPGGWHYEKDEHWTAAQILELEAKVEDVRIAANESAKIAGEKFKDKIRELKTANPHLRQVSDSENDRVTAAKNIRVELARAFPGIKFSVTGKSFSGGDSIDIDWTDGPTSKQVETIIDKYSGGDFDGMTDSYNYRHSPWTEAFGKAKYVMAQRCYSDTLIARAIAELTSEYSNKDAPTVEDFNKGSAWNTSPFTDSGYRDNSWQSLIHRRAGETDCTTKPKTKPSDDINVKIAAAMEEQNRLLTELAKSRA